LAAELEPGRTFRLLGVGMANFGDDLETLESSKSQTQQLPLFGDDGAQVKSVEK